MFGNCTSLEEINLGKLNSENIIYMTGMFESCTSLTSLDLSSFNTKNVTDASYLLNECINLKYLDFSQFNTKNLKYYEGIFNGLPDIGTLIYNSSIFNESIIKLLPDTWDFEDIEKLNFN